MVHPHSAGWRSGDWHRLIIHLPFYWCPLGFFFLSLFCFIDFLKFYIYISFFSLIFTLLIFNLFNDFFFKVPLMAKFEFLDISFFLR